MQKQNILIDICAGRLRINGRVNQVKGKMKWKCVHNCPWPFSLVGTT